MITSFKVVIANREKEVLINRNENIPRSYQVHIDNKYEGDLYFRLRKWNIDNSIVNNDDIQKLGTLAETIG